MVTSFLPKISFMIIRGGSKTASTSKMERIVIPLQWYSTEANAATLARKGYFTKIWRYWYNNNRYPEGSNDVALVRSHK